MNKVCFEPSQRQRLNDKRARIGVCIHAVTIIADATLQEAVAVPVHQFSALGVVPTKQVLTFQFVIQHEPKLASTLLLDAHLVLARAVRKTRIFDVRRIHC